MSDILGNGKGRCHARDGRGHRCTDPQDGHPTVVNPQGRTVLSHHTAASWWCTENPRGPGLVDQEEPKLWTPGMN